MALLCNIKGWTEVPQRGEMQPNEGEDSYLLDLHLLVVCHTKSITNLDNIVIKIVFFLS